ncbi:MAG: cytochrome c peroxidase [Myxococcaceae bacterium]
MKIVFLLAFLISQATFADFSKQLQVSCANCHTPNQTQYPFYFKFPIVKQIIEKDISEAQAEFLLDPSHLSVTDLRKIRKEIAEDAMPPLKYKIMHWDSWISAKQKESMLAYIDQELERSKPEALTSKHLPKVDAQKVALGKSMFFDTRLSGDNTISCASCHNLSKGGTDQSQVATGIKNQKGPINSPTVLNAVFNSHQFWDGRAKNLQEQAAGPVTNPKEMGSTWPQVFSNLQKDKKFTQRFRKTYPEGYSVKNITEAIAEYEKTLVTLNSPYDLFLLGDKTALTAEQQKGYELFIKNDCMSCHAGPALGGKSFEKMGHKKDYFAWRNRTPAGADLGRFNFTGQESDKFKFKVPTLRNIALTYPYFHDGSTKDLVEAVQIMSRFQNGKELSLQDARAIAEFLKSTTGAL